MIIYFAVIMLITLFSCSLWPKGEWKTGYLSKEECACVKGVFVLLLFFGHVVNFIEPAGVLDTSYLAVKKHLDQAVVAMFLFYSGFGMAQALEKKGISYITSMPRRRFVPVYGRFVISVIIFYIVNTCLHQRPPKKMFLAALAGWKDIGNFGWYILVIMSLYILFAACYGPFMKGGYGRGKMIAGTVIFTALSVVMLFLLRNVAHREPWYYNTILIFSLGIWYSIFKDKLTTFFGNNIRYVLSLIVIAGVYLTATHFRRLGIYVYEVWITMFTLGVVLITMKIRVKSRVLKFFGGLALPMFILQGLPYIVLKHFELNVTRPHLFIVLSFVISVGLSVVFQKATAFLDTKK